jgi:hypothetical protein
LPATDLLDLFVRPISRLGWPYAVTGSVGSMFYAEPRFTNDVDVVLRIPAGGARTLRAAFPEPAFYRPSVEEIALECARASRGHINVIHIESGLKADLYFAGADPLSEWALSSARTLEVAGLPVRVAPPEYVILRKLSYYREGGSEKHLRDIRGVLMLADPPVDRDALLRRLDEADLGELFRRLFP